MTDTLWFVVEGKPVPKGRARTFARMRRDGKPFVTTTTPPETRAYEQRVKLLAQVAVVAAKWTWTKDDRFSIVVRVFREHWDAGGDLDNVFKALADAMIGVVMPDDRYVRGIGIAFGDPDPKRPRVEIEVRKYPKRKAA